MQDRTGPERIRAAIKRARGGHLAPPPVRICGEQDPNAMRADDPRWPGNRIPRRSAREHALGSLANAIMCPACFRLRCSPMHWFTC